MGEIQGMRDDGASLRLTAAALRLGEFTVRELSESAEANYETARDFVARRRTSGVLVSLHETQIGTADQGVEKSVPGRPPQRYRVSDNQRNTTEKRLKEIRSSLANVSRSPIDFASSIEDADEMGPLIILERSVRALSRAEEFSDDDRQARLADIEILRDAAEKDVMALTTRGADAHRILSFGRRLGTVTAVYEELKRPRALAVARNTFLPIEKSEGVGGLGAFSDAISAVSETWRYLVDEFVLACDGHWMGGIASARSINRFVVLLDGIPKRQDPVTSRLLRDCVADALSVVTFETEAFRQSDWDQMRSYLHRIQMAAPSVVRGMFVTVDGSTANAFSLIKEVSRFDKIASAADFPPLGSHVGVTLRGAENHPGRIFCFDLVSQPDLGQTCEAVGIHYVGDAAEIG